MCLEELYGTALHDKDDYYQSYIKKERENEKIKKSSARRKWLLLFLSLFLIFLIVFSYIMYRYQRGRERHLRFNAIQNQRLRNSYLLQENLKVEQMLYNKNKDLEHMHALYNQRAISISLMQKYLLKDLGEIANKINKGDQLVISEDTWKETENLLNYTDNDFVTKLRKRYPKLKEDDCRLCMLVRLKITNERIGMFFSITKSAVQKRKSNLKKQYFQVSDPELTLEQFLDNLSQERSYA